MVALGRVQRWFRGVARGLPASAGSRDGRTATVGLRLKKGGLHVN